MNKNTNPDFAKRLTDSEFNLLKSKALDFIMNNLKKDNTWHRCYSLKQKMTSRIGYCFQANMYEFLKECDFSVKIDSEDDHWAKATYRRNSR
jgi:hypothetical protein